MPNNGGFGSDCTKANVVWNKQLFHAGSSAFSVGSIYLEVLLDGWILLLAYMVELIYGVFQRDLFIRCTINSIPTPTEMVALGSKLYQTVFFVLISPRSTYIRRSDDGKALNMKNLKNISPDICACTNGLHGWRYSVIACGKWMGTS